MANENANPPLVCILTYNNLCMFEFGIALEVFAEFCTLNDNGYISMKG